jgi:hypothetical protein
VAAAAIEETMTLLVPPWIISAASGPLPSSGTCSSSQAVSRTVSISPSSPVS